jgi:hypothetical protein
LNHLAGPKDNSTRSGKFEAGYLKQICMTELLTDLTFDLAKFDPLVRVSPMVPRQRTARMRADDWQGAALRPKGRQFALRTRGASP